MKILQINKFFYPKGGSETYFFNLIKLLEEQGHEVMHFSTKHPKNKSSKYSKFFIDEIDYSNNKKLFSKVKNFIINPQAVAKLEELLKIEKPDVAHLHNIHHQLTPVIVKVLKKYKIPIVQTLHDYQVICPNYLLYTKGAVCQRCKPKKYYQCVLNRCVEKSYLKSFLSSVEMNYNRQTDDYLKNIDVLISPSKFLKQTLEDWGVDNKIVHLSNFTTIKPLADIEPKDYYLYFGRLSKEKGLNTLIKAFSKMPDKKLIIAGTGPLKIKASKNIQLVGFKTGDELTRLIQESKAVIIPSEWYENNPMSALEALALQKPLIVANIGGLPELTSNLFEPGNVEELIEIIKRNQCHQSNHIISVSTHYKEILKIYEEAINNN